VLTFFLKLAIRSIPFGGNMLRRFLTIAVVILAGWSATGIAANPDEGSALLRVREVVWRSWFANDAKTLRELVPPETIVISAGEKQWKHRAAVLQSAADFHAQGGKLIRLEFPRTEIQQFGEVAILYSDYRLETEMHGKQSVTSGRATEIFVRRNGQWTNPGWHTDEEK
jgi:ketosteroid isomerase-like protein